VADEKKFSEVGLDGLSSSEADRLLAEWGKNEIPEEKTSPIMLFLKQFVGVMPACIIATIILAAAAQDWVDFTIIICLLFMNAGIGFREEMHAQSALDELRGDLTQEIQAKRDGKPVSLDVTCLVPGDIIQLKGGDVIPADCIWYHGDTVKVDTAPLTGEPIPWNVPRNDPEKGKLLWSGCTVTNGECLAKVDKTGVNTEIGTAFSAAGEQGGATKSGFEKKIILIVSIIIGIAAILAVIMIVVQSVARNLDIKIALLSGVSLLIGSVPVALPLVLVVTMAIGSVTMSTYDALVTSLPALQEIASMTVLCSDKTGTLTTAKMDVMNELIYTLPGFNAADIFEMSVACCNRTNMGDAIDGGIMRKYDTIFANGDAEAGSALIDKKWKAGPANGFHNAAKRTIHELTNLETGATIVVAKGLVTKLLSCKHTDGGVDPEEECDHAQWICKDYEKIVAEVEAKDNELGIQGYKTIGVGVFNGTMADLKAGKGEFVFAGLVPMIDPPRLDTALTIQRIREAGVEVKMITGDHQNIAKTTAGLINLGTNILSNKQLAIGPTNPPNVRDKLIREADGFAQVMPTDKMDVVLTLQKAGLVVGFSGDGVNDVPALAAAEVGVAVHGATDAANATADIQLLSPGLSAIYTAIVESRKIFRRIKAYVIYRVAATIQMVIVLAILTLVSGCMIDSLYIVIIAIMNDLTMMPLSSDKQRAARNPDRPIVWAMLLQATIYGVLEAIFTLIFFYLGGYWQNDHKSTFLDGNTCGRGFDGDGLRQGWFNPHNDLTYNTDYEHWSSYLWQPNRKDNLKNCVKAYCNTAPCVNVPFVVFNSNSSNPGCDGTFYVEGQKYGPGLFPAQYCPAGPGLCTANEFVSLAYPATSFAYNNGTYCTDTATTAKYPQLDLAVANDIKHYATRCGMVSPTTPWAGSANCPCSESMRSLVFLQLLISAEILIYPMRTLSWMWTSMASPWLYVSTLGVCIFFTILAAFGQPQAIFGAAIGWGNAGFVWAYCIGCLIIIDLTKYLVVMGLEGSTDEIPTDKEIIDPESNEAEEARNAGGGGSPTEGMRRKSTMQRVQSNNANAGNYRASVLQGGSLLGGAQRLAGGNRSTVTYDIREK